MFCFFSHQILRCLKENFMTTSNHGSKVAVLEYMSYDSIVAESWNHMTVDISDFYIIF